MKIDNCFHFFWWWKKIGIEWQSLHIFLLVEHKIRRFLVANKRDMNSNNNNKNVYGWFRVEIWKERKTFHIRMQISAHEIKWAETIYLFITHYDSNFRLYSGFLSIRIIKCSLSYCSNQFIEMVWAWDALFLTTHFKYRCTEETINTKQIIIMSCPFFRSSHYHLWGVAISNLGI